MEGSYFDTRKEQRRVNQAYVPGEGWMDRHRAWKRTMGDHQPRISGSADDEIPAEGFVEAFCQGSSSGWWVVARECDINQMGCFQTDSGSLSGHYAQAGAIRQALRLLQEKAPGESVRVIGNSKSAIDVARRDHDHELGNNLFGDIQKRQRSFSSCEFVAMTGHSLPEMVLYRDAMREQQ